MLIIGIYILYTCALNFVFSCDFAKMKATLEGLRVLADVSRTDQLELEVYHCMKLYRQGLYAEVCSNMIQTPLKLTSTRLSTP